MLLCTSARNWLIGDRKESLPEGLLLFWKTASMFCKIILISLSRLNFGLWMSRVQEGKLIEINWIIKLYKLNTKILKHYYITSTKLITLFWILDVILILRDRPGKCGRPEHMTISPLTLIEEAYLKASTSLSKVGDHSTSLTG